MKPRSGYTADMMAQLEAAMHNPPAPEIPLRAKALWMFAQGEALKTIMKACRCARATIYTWDRAFKAGGIDGLMDGNLNRSTPIVRKGYVEYLQRMLAQEPGECGYPGEVGWTVALLRMEMHQATSTDIGDRRLRNLLLRLGYAYQLAEGLPGIIAPKPKNMTEFKAWVERCEQLPFYQRRKWAQRSV